MLRRILSISGRPGLFSLVNSGKNMLIVENITDHRRFPAYAHDKVISLGDITMYSADRDVPLSEVLESVKTLNDAQPVDIKAIGNEAALREYFGKVLPDYDRDRVYTADIRKLLSWYNTLINAGITDFTEPEEQTDEAPATESETTPAAE